MKNFKQKGEFQIYTDGACSNTSIYGEGGAAYLILDSKGNHFKEASKGFIKTTNNRMEVLAIVSAINSLPKNSSAVVYTDSKYAITILTNDIKPCANPDLWRRYREVSTDISVRFEWVKGHNGNYYNEQVDYMAQQARESMVEKYSLPADRFKKRRTSQPSLFNI